jgi:hypothetical protein
MGMVCKLLKIAVFFIVCFLWGGIGLAGRYSDDSREYSENTYRSTYSSSRWEAEKKREEEQKKKNIIKYTTIGVVGAAYVGFKVMIADDSDKK